MSIKKIRTDKFPEIRAALKEVLHVKHHESISSSPRFLNHWIARLEREINHGRNFIHIESVVTADGTRKTFICRESWIIEVFDHQPVPQSMTDYHNEISRFWKLHALGRNAALDIEIPSGNVYCRRHIGNGHRHEEGVGAIPAIYSDSFSRIMETVAGNLRYDWWVDDNSVTVAAR